MIVAKLGEGGMGVVYKAEDTRLKRPVALKFLSADLLRTGEEKKRFLHEARTAARLSHANICTVYDIDEFEGIPFIVMEYIEGETLREKIAVSLLKLPEILDFSIKIGQGLQAAHEKGIVHRDIKSANIMVTPAGQVKIMDFGLALSTGQTRITQVGSTLGTVAYMSPEQTRGERIDPRTDIWAFGVVLYEIITGQMPFQGDYEQALIYSILQEEPEPVTGRRSGVPIELERIVEKALRKRPDQRYQHVQEMLVDLRDIAEKDQSGDRKRSGSALPKKSMRSKTGVWMAVSVVLTFLLVFFLIHSFGTRTGDGAVHSGEKLLAVMLFENLIDPEDSRREAQMISNLVITDLAESKYFRVVSDQRLHDLIKELGLGDHRVIDKSIATRVAQQANASTMLMGQINRLGENIILTSQLLDTHSGEILESQRVNGQDMFTLVDSLCREIKKDLAFSKSNLAENDHAVAELTTHSQEAYRYYLQGNEYYENYNFEAAEECFKNAVFLDSTFALAYSRLAWMQFRFGMGNMDLAAATSAIAYRLRQRVAEKEQDYIEAVYLASRASIDDGIMPLKRLLKKYPEEKEAWLGLATAVGGPMENPLKAISYHEKWLKLDPVWKAGYQFIIRDYLNLGRDEEAKFWGVKYVELAPQEAAAHHILGYVYYYMDNPEMAKEEFGRALTLDPDYLDALIGRAQALALQGRFVESDDQLTPLVTRQYAPTYRIGAYQQLAWNSLAQGKYRQAMEQARHILNIIQTDHIDWMLPYGHKNLGIIYYLIDQLELARKEFEYNVEHPGLIRVRFGFGSGYYWLGLISVDEGRYEDAIIWDDRLKSLAEKDENSLFDGLHHDLASKITLESMSSVITEPELSGILERDWWGWMTDMQIPPEWDLAQIAEKKGSQQVARTYYEQIIGRKYPWRFNLLYARSLFRLGKLSQQQGAGERSAHYFRQFLDIWKDADQDLEEIVEAKKGLSD